MITLKSPMLAASLLPSDVEHTDDEIFAALQCLKFPVMATLKKDGIRGLRLNNSLLSRTFKHIPNKLLRERSLVMPGGFDVELWNKGLQYHQIESIVMSHEHPDTALIEFHVIDWVTPGCYAERMQKIMQTMPLIPRVTGVRFSPPVVCHNAEQLMAFFKICEDQAGEGMCFRTPVSPYKQGRSTLNEQWLVKLSRYVREEAVIVGFVEQMENTNRSKWNGVGKMDRGKQMEGMIGKNTLGAFVVVPRGTHTMMHHAFKFNIGTGVGLTDKLRKEIWENREKYIGRTITYKTKPHGKVIKPRSPIWIGFREEGY